MRYAGIRRRRRRGNQCGHGASARAGEGRGRSRSHQAGLISSHVIHSSDNSVAQLSGATFWFIGQAPKRIHGGYQVSAAMDACPSYRLMPEAISLPNQRAIGGYAVRAPCDFLRVGAAERTHVSWPPPQPPLLLSRQEWRAEDVLVTIWEFVFGKCHINHNFLVTARKSILLRTCLDY